MLWREHLLFFLDLKANHDYRFMKEKYFLIIHLHVNPNTKDHKQNK